MATAEPVEAAMDPTIDDLNPSCADPFDTENGVTVRVTLCPVGGSEDKPSANSDPNLMDPFASKSGLSCMSLEVLTSGEHLDDLSLEDLSDEERESTQGSIPDCLSVEAEVRLEDCCGEDQLEGQGEKGSELVVRTSISDQENCPGKGLEQELERPAVEEGFLNSPPTVVEVPCQAPSDNSRCSSCMGYTEPRPTSQSPLEDDQQLSPKDIQKHLMEKVNSIGPKDEISVAEEAEPVAVSAIPTSQSSQSLNSYGGSKGSKGISFGSIFRRRSSLAKREHNPETMAATSTTGLILHDRPKTLPAKNPLEEHRHQQLHQQMMAAARKKELQKAKQEMEKEKRKRERDKLVSNSLVEWERVLSKWENLHNTRKVRELWWQGLPPGVRGKVWKKAIGNELHISSDLFVINLRRCKERLALARERSDSTASQVSVSREQSVEVIHLDVLRTFPTLGFFQEGGPYNQSLCDVLGAYACYRPDIGYVQGMSFLAGVLLLNMDAGDAFISLANLLNRPSYLAFFKVDHTLMQPYFNSFTVLLRDSLPKLSAHFSKLEFSPEYYLIEWIFTIYTRVLPLDVACRVWDMFCRDGDAFLFRTALGILKLFQSSLLGFRSIEDMGQFLGKLPPDMDSDTLFSQIDSVHVTPRRFKQILAQQHSRHLADST